MTARWWVIVAALVGLGVGLIVAAVLLGRMEDEIEAGVGA